MFKFLNNVKSSKLYKFVFIYRFFGGFHKLFANLYIVITKSYKATQIRVDICNKRHILFNIKYINNSLQIIKDFREI